MKKRLSIILAALLCIALTACNGTAAVSLLRYPGNAALLTTIAEVSALENYTLVAPTSTENPSDLFVFKQAGENGGTTHKVYNLATGTEVHSTTDEGSTVCAGIKVVNEPLSFIVTMNSPLADQSTRTEYTWFDAKGNSLQSTTDSDLAEVVVYGDRAVFGGGVYRFDEQGIEFTAADSPFRKLVEPYAWTDEYYYVFDGSSSAPSISFYDNFFDLVASYRVPAYAEEFASAPMVLDDGKVLLQYLVEVPADADQYDLYLEGVKLAVHSVLIDPATGKGKEIKLDFAVMMGFSRSTIYNGTSESFESLSDKVKNAALIIPFEDKSADESMFKYVSLSNSCKITGELSMDFGGHAEIGEPVGENHFVFGDYLVDEKGKVKGNIEGATILQGLIVMNDNIYDYDLTCVYELGDEESIAFMTDRGVMIKYIVDDGGTRHKFYNGTMTEISGINTFDTSLSARGLYVGMTDTGLIYFNDNGTQLLTRTTEEGALTLIGYSADSVLLQGGDKYYWAA